VDDKKSAADFLFLDDNLATSPAAVQRAFLSPFNIQVDGFNQLILSHISGDPGMRSLSYLLI
jgi:hypothetical protein